MSIVPATESDKGWVLALYNRYAKELGCVGNSVWYRYWHASSNRERWLVAQPGLGFIHYRIRRDGFRVIYEVASSKCGVGIGGSLVRAIGLPVELKTDVDNGPANAFYRGLGFQVVGLCASKDGKRTFNIYRAFELRPASLLYTQRCHDL